MIGVKIAPRSLSIDESAVLGALLSVDFEGVDQLRDQARDAMVVGPCDCGCPTASLAVRATAPVAVLPHRLSPVWGRVVTGGHESLGEIVLFLRGSRLDSLEFVYYDDVPTSWPPVGHINIVTPPT